MTFDSYAGWSEFSRDRRRIDRLVDLGHERTADVVLRDWADQFVGDLAIAAAEIDGHPLAAEPERLRQAAAEIAGHHPDASPDDVLLWAEARALPAA